MKIFLIIVGILVVLTFIGGQYFKPQTTAKPAPSPATTVSGKNKVKIFLVALEDNGKQGKKIGCDDSLIYKEQEITSAPDQTERQIREVLRALFSDKFKNGQGFYNAFASSDLQIADIAIADNGAIIKLSGSLNLGGVCDNSRVEEQLQATVSQFSGVEIVKIYLNDKLLHDVLSGKGGE